MPLRIAVNLSPAQFRDHDLLRFIQCVLESTGLAPT
jgi:EAL domain-containing protein (putative c-di-GMP-specific phosphodiesterase class I)